MGNKSDNQRTNPRSEADGSSFSQVCERRFSRRKLLKGAGALSATWAVGGLSACSSNLQSSQSDIATIEGLAKKSSFNFEEIAHGIDQHHHIASDHEAEILLRWGDPIFETAPEFDVNRQTAAKQLTQFGYNNDYVGYVGLPLEPGDECDERALLCVNHEYPSYGLMFPNFGKDRRKSLTKEMVQVAQAASGNTIVEVSRKGSQWQVEKGSKYNRRINALNTEMEIRGPAAGSSRLATNADPKAKTVIGTINNCAGGITPWGTYLTCEENFSYYFGGKLAKNHREENNYSRYNLPLDIFAWSTNDSRFDIGVEPNEPNRFGWVVEIDPMDPASTPIKRTALGRFKHEGGENIVASDGRLVVYMGDDQRFEYLYKFVSRDKVDMKDRAANRNLLDHGTLYAAKFSDDGSHQWLALDINNPLLAEHFASQTDILIEPRSAADLLQATPMDRPEDVTPNPANGKVYVMLTNNTKRSEGNSANPRTGNPFGHIVELSESNGDHTAGDGTWKIVVKCGDPAKPEHDSDWNANTSENGWFASPDNAEVDTDGRLWIATDQGEKVELSGTSDGLWGLETEGAMRGTGKMFFRVPVGAELCGPIFSDNGESLFFSVQHPGAIDTRPGAARFDTATTLWPDFKQGTPPKPSLMVVRRKGGGKVG